MKEVEFETSQTLSNKQKQKAYGRYGIYFIQITPRRYAKTIEGGKKSRYLQVEHFLWISELIFLSRVLELNYYFPLKNKLCLFAAETFRALLKRDKEKERELENTAAKNRGKAVSAPTTAV